MFGRETALDDKTTIAVVVIVQLTIVVIFPGDLGILQTLGTAVLGDELFDMIGRAWRS